MCLLFVNACYREGSRTRKLAEHYLKRYKGDVEEVSIGDLEVCALDRKRLELYNHAVAAHDLRTRSLTMQRSLRKQRRF